MVTQTIQYLLCTLRVKIHHLRNESKKVRWFFIKHLHDKESNGFFCKMNLCLLYGIMLSSFFFFESCTSTMELKVIDDKNKTFINNAEVSSACLAESKWTDNNGTVFFKAPKGKSCQYSIKKTGYEDLTILRQARQNKQPIEAYLKQLVNWPNLSPIKFKPPLDSKESNVRTANEGNLRCTYKDVEWGPEFSEYLNFDPQGAVIYPGAMISSKGFEEGSYQPIVGDRKPIKISISLSMIGGKISEEISNPSLSSVREGISRILSTRLSGPTQAAVQWKKHEIYSQSHLKLSLHGNYDNSFAKISAKYNFNQSSITSRYLLEFEQVYYSIDVDIPPSGLQNWFHSPPNVNLGTYSPMYVASVKYGRKVFFLIEDDSLNYSHAASLEGKFKALASSGNISIDGVMSRLVREKKITAIIMGGASSDALNVISDISQLRKYFTDGANYSRDNPGVPLSYTLNFVADNSIAKLVKYDRYKIRDCQVIPAEEQEFSITDKLNLCPTHVEGDREFNGHGPNMTAQARLEIIGESQIKLIVSFEARETRSDWTTARGSWDYIVFEAPPGKKIATIRTSLEARYRGEDDNGHNLNVITPKNQDLVSKFEIRGDTPGNDVGNCNVGEDTMISIYFNRVRIAYKTN